MEIDDNLFFNFIPILATILATTVASIIVIQRVKLRWPITVNCWFCNKNCKIWRSESDWWRCPSCEQHNGFTKDGDYNYEIPEQKKRSLNNKIWTNYSSSPKSASNKNRNGLCLDCNRNEELKMCEMKSIDPTRWRQSKIDDFMQNLESKYPICRNCDTFIKIVLRKQAKWLTQYKMLFFKQKPINIIVNNAEKAEKICRILLTILSPIIIYHHTLQPLPIFGAFLQLFIVAKRINSRGTSDALLTLLWLAIFAFMPFHNLRLYKLNLKHRWFTMKYLTGYQIITFLSTILGFFNATSRKNSSRNPNMSFKKLETSMDESSFNSSSELKDFMSENESHDRRCSDRRSPIDITHLLTPQASVEVPAPIKPIPIPANFRVHDVQQSLSPTLTEIPQENSNMNEFTSKQTMNDSLRTLGGLSLSGSNKKQSSRSPKVFETKTYGTTSPDLFNNSFCNKSSRRQFILAPPKLKSVTQTSWVAGGYWQMGMDPPSLSRSSSQSSGFGSGGSNFAPSREPSVVNEIDRCSVVSDSTICCHSPQNISPMNSYCSHISPYRVPTPINSIPNLPCYQQSQRTFYHPYHPNEYVINRSINNNSFQQTSELPVCLTHPTTVVTTNPSWLPALVCGSIVLNVIVFCVVLIR